MEIIYRILEMIIPFSWIEYNFMKNALLAIILITPLFGLVGTMIVNNKMSFFSDALGHCAFTGIAIGLMLGSSNYLISMMFFSLLFALGISFVIHSKISSSDTVIGIFSSSGIAVGIAILSTKGGISKYSSYLVGDILSITKRDILLLVIVLVAVVIAWILCFNKLMLASLNTDLALSKQINFKFYNNLFAIIIASIVTISIRWVGMLIINSLLIIPAASAKNVANSIRMYHLTSIGFSVVSGITGLIISYYSGISAGAAIVLVSAAIFFVTFAINRFFKCT